MSQNFTFEKYRTMFQEYAGHYDRADGRIELKIIHTNSVVKIMEILCEKRRLPEHTTRLAMLCALFHDIGRFEQLKQYGTFLDHESCDHAELSCAVLKSHHMLADLPESDQASILTAIANHNRYEIAPEIIEAAKPQVQDSETRDSGARDSGTRDSKTQDSETQGSGARDFAAQEYETPNSSAQECLELCKLLRDADKCDIFRVFAVDDMTDVVGAPEEEIAGERISPAVRQAILEHRCVNKLIRRTYLDFWISFLGFFFDLNYPESVEIAKTQGYYRMPFDRVTFSDPETHTQVHEILEEIEHYIFAITGSAETIPAPLRQFFSLHKTMALAFSGGTDSAYLLYAAVKCGCNVRAYYVSTPFQPQFELDDAKRLAKELNAPMTVLPFDVLTLEDVKRNPPDRCYYCKNGIFHMILEAAAADGYREIMDGTNASDDAGDRPGMRALRELRVLSPLRECGVTKKALREYSRNAGLFTWNKPAYACLATRIPANVRIEKDMLGKIETAEAYLSSMGFSDFRVRVLPEASDASYTAKLQVTDTQLPLLLEKRPELLEFLKGEFDSVLLDLNTRASSVIL